MTVEQEQPDSDKSFIEDYVDSLTEEEMDAMWAVIADIEASEELDPLVKFKRGNPGQEELIHTKSNLTLVLCGNRWGKTFAMCFFLVATALKRLPTSRHQPEPTRILRVWFIAQNYKTLNDEVLKTITGFLRRNQYRVYKDNNTVTRIDIYGPNKEVTEVLLKPSTADPETFESASPHYILVDEGISEDLFARCMIRLGGNRGQYIQCFTRLTYNFVSELAKGRGQFKQLFTKGHIKVIRGRTRDNIFLTEEEHALLEDSMAGNEFLRRARLEGDVDKPEGVVFNFKETYECPISGEDINYNLFSFSEFKAIYKQHDGDWYLLHDYGFGVASVWILVWVDRYTGTTYFVDEVYAKGLSIHKSTKSVYEMLHRWKCYNTVKECIADRTIKSDTSKLYDSDATANILGQYMVMHVDERDETSDFCLPPHMAWICKEKHKRRPEYGLQLINSLLELENPLTPALPYYRFSPRMECTSTEFRQLRFADRMKTSQTKNEITVGDDHATDAIRYFTVYRVNIDAWEGRESENFNKTNDLGYLIGYSRATYFNF